MNRPSPSILWSGTGVLSLLGLCLAVLNGAGRTVEWLPSLATPPSPINTASVVPATPIALQAYRYTWEKPLFTTQRRPDPPFQNNAEKAPPPLNGLALTGVITSGKVRKAFFKIDDGQPLAALEQQTLPNGWRVEKIEPLRVSLVHGAETQTLPLLRLKAPQNTVPPTTSPPSPSTFKDRNL